MSADVIKLLKNNKGLSSFLTIITVLLGVGGVNVFDTATKFNKLIENSETQIRDIRNIQTKQIQIINAINRLGKEQITIEDLANVHNALSIKNHNQNYLSAEEIAQLVLKRKIADLAKKGILDVENNTEF